MIFKITGALLVCISSTLIGIYMSLKGGYRLLQLIDIKKSLLMLRAEIEFSRNTLPSAFLSISERTCDELSEFFLLLHHKFSEKNGDGALLIWNNALDKILSKTYLEANDLKSLQRLGAVLGHPDSSLQLDTINMILLYIDETTAKLNTQNEKNKRMYRSVGVIGGILITVMLI